MSAAAEPRAAYRFDPHDEGLWLGLGLVRLSLVCGGLLLGTVALYLGHLVLALALLILVPPVVLARWDGLPLLAWIPLRIGYRITGPRVWAADPESVGFVTPLAPTTPDAGTDPAPEPTVTAASPTDPEEGAVQW